MIRIIDTAIFVGILLAMLAWSGLLLREYVSEQSGSDVIGFEMHPMHPHGKGLGI